MVGANRVSPAGSHPGKKAPRLNFHARSRPKEIAVNPYQRVPPYVENATAWNTDKTMQPLHQYAGPEKVGFSGQTYPTATFTQSDRFSSQS